MEAEIKLLLTAEEHARLRRAWGPPARAVEQESSFFDTPDGLLRRKNLALRLRREGEGEGEGERHFLTLKGGGRREGAAYLRPELEEELCAEEACAFGEGRIEWGAGPLAELKKALGKRPGLKLVGRLRNERLFFRVRGLEVLLDETTFPDGSRSYELECELEPEAIPGAEALLGEELARAGVGWTPSPSGKYARLLRVLGLM